MSNPFQRRASKNRKPVLEMQPPFPEIADQAMSTQTVQSPVDETLPKPELAELELVEEILPAPVELAPAAEIEQPATYVESPPVVDQWDEPVSPVVAAEAETPWGREDVTPESAPDAPAVLFAEEPAAALPVPSAAEFFGEVAAADSANGWDQPVTVASLEVVGDVLAPADELAASDSIGAAVDLAAEPVIADPPFLFESPGLDDLEDEEFEPALAETHVGAVGRHSAPVELDAEFGHVEAADAVGHEDWEQAGDAAQVTAGSALGNAVAEDPAPVLYEATVEPVPTLDAPQTEIEPQPAAVPELHQALDTTLELTPELVSHAEALTQTAWTLSEFARTKSPPAQEVLSFEVAALSMHTAELNYQYAVFNSAGEVELVTYDVAEVLSHFGSRVLVEGEPQPMVQVRAIRADYWRTLDWGQGALN